MIFKTVTKVVTWLTIWISIPTPFWAGQQPEVKKATYWLVAESSMVKVMPDFPVLFLADRYGDRLLQPGQPLEITVAGGEVEAGQIIVAPRNQALRNVKFKVSDLKNSRGIALPSFAVTLDVMGYVKTIPESRLLYQVDRIGWFPDPILPFIDEFDVEQGKVQSLWLSIQCPAGQEPGIYQGEVTVSPQNSVSKTIPVIVRVFDFTLPKNRSLPTLIATFTKNLERIHGDDWDREMYWRYVDFLHAHRLNMDNIFRDPEPPPTPADVKRLIAGGQDAWCLRYIRQPGPGGSDPGVDPELFPQYRDEAIENARATLEVFKQADAEDLCYMVIFDEVREAHFDALVETSQKVRKALPGIPIVTSAMDLRYGLPVRIQEVIDSWLSSLPFYFNADQSGRTQVMRENGTQVYLYTAVWPARPFPNFFIEYDVIETRIFMGAMTQRFKPDGVAYWATNFWPFNEKPITTGPYTDWNPKSTNISHGDGSLMCAGRDGPITTIRLENFRDGIEDYEYYQLLEQAIAEAKQRELPPELIDRAQRLLAVPDGIVRTPTYFTRDPELLAQHRVQIAETIVRLRRLRK